MSATIEPSAPTIHTPEFVERGYNNRAAVPEHPQWLARYSEESRKAVARALAASSTFATARRRRRRSTCSCPRVTARGTFVFIHGGYWRALDKVGFFVRCAAVRGAQGSPSRSSTTICVPTFRSTTIVDQCRRAVAWHRAGGAEAGGLRRAAGRRRPFGGRPSGRDDVRDRLAPARPHRRAVRRRRHVVRRPRPDAAHRFPR